MSEKWYLAGKEFFYTMRHRFPEGSAAVGEG